MFIQIPEYHWGSSCEKMGLTNGWSGTPSRSQALGRTVLLQEMYVCIYFFFFLWPPLRSLRRVTECRAHGEKRASWCIPQSRVWSSWRILCLKLQLLSNAQHMNRLNSETNRQNALCMRRCSTVTKWHWSSSTEFEGRTRERYQCILHNIQNLTWALLLLRMLGCSNKAEPQCKAHSWSQVQESMYAGALVTKFNLKIDWCESCQNIKLHQPDTFNFL